MIDRSFDEEPAFGTFVARKPVRRSSSRVLRRPVVQGEGAGWLRNDEPFRVGCGRAMVMVAAWMGRQRRSMCCMDRLAGAWPEVASGYEAGPGTCSTVSKSGVDAGNRTYEAFFGNQTKHINCFIDLPSRTIPSGTTLGDTHFASANSLRCGNEGKSILATGEIV